jgi:hypothetical protein
MVAVEPVGEAAVGLPDLEDVGANLVFEQSGAVYREIRFSFGSSTQVASKIEAMKANRARMLQASSPPRAIAAPPRNEVTTDAAAISVAVRARSSFSEDSCWESVRSESSYESFASALVSGSSGLAAISAISVG